MNRYLSINKVLLPLTVKIIPRQNKNGKSTHYVENITYFCYMAKKLPGEIRIRNSNMRLVRELNSIAKSEGITRSQLCRRELLKAVASYSEAARNYNDDGS